MGSISSYATAAGRRYRVRFRKPDQTQTDKRGFKSKREAELFLASLEVSKARGEYVDSIAGRITLGELGTEWLKHRGHLKPSSTRPLEIAWRLHVSPRWERVRVSDVRFSDVQAWPLRFVAAQPPCSPRLRSPRRFWTELCGIVAS